MINQSGGSCFSSGSELIYVTSTNIFSDVGLDRETVSKILGVSVFALGVGMILLFYSPGMGLYMSDPATYYELHPRGLPQWSQGRLILFFGLTVLFIALILAFIYVGSKVGSRSRWSPPYGHPHHH